MQHTASVLRVWPRTATPSPTAGMLTFVRYSEKDEDEPYAIGQDFVVFVQWMPEDHMFLRMSSGDGTVAAFAIENGRIRTAPFGGYVGMSVDQLLAELDGL